MTHILVKWLKEPKWDVYPFRNLVDKELGLRVMDDPSLMDAMGGGGGGKVFQIRWSDDKRPDDAFVIAVGSLKSMEKRRNHVIQMAVGGHFAPCSDDATSSFAADVAALRSENARLQKKVTQLEDSYDASRMVKRFDKMAARMNSCEPPPRPETPTKMVRLGDGTAVSQRMMDQLASFNTSPSLPVCKGPPAHCFHPRRASGVLVVWCKK
ncbi:unnamed protein product [Ixodes pacificus]